MPYADPNNPKRKAYEIKYRLVNKERIRERHQAKVRDRLTIAIN